MVQDASDGTHGGGAGDAGESDGAKAKKRTPGCFLVAALFAAGTLSGGIYLLTQWNALGGGGKAAAVVLVVIGTLFAAPIVIIGGIYLGLRIFIGRITKDLTNAGNDVRKAGRSIL